MGSPSRVERQGRTHVSTPAVVEPMVVFPRMQRGDWYADARACITRYLPRQGAILFRGFAVDEARLLAALGASKRERDPAWGQRDLTLVRCREALAETRLVDMRELYRALPGPTRARLVDRGLRFVQTWSAEHWRRELQDWTAVIAWCARNDTAYEWLDDGRLRLTRSMPAVRLHGNQLCWSALTARFLQASPDVVRELRQGDGAPLEPSQRADLERALNRLHTVIEWEPDDLLVVDRTVSACCDPLDLEDTPGLVCTPIVVESRPEG